MPDAIRARRAPRRTPLASRIEPLPVALLGALLCLLLVSCGGRAPQGNAPEGSAPGPDAAAAAAAPTAPAGPVSRSLDVTVAPGDTLERIFRAQGLAIPDLAALRADPTLRRSLDRLRPGDRLRFATEDGRLVGLERPVRLGETLLATRTAEGGFRSETRVETLERSVRSAGAAITGSLFQSAKDAGISDTMALAIADIFRFDIDFVLDIRPGDSFSVVHEVLSRDGRVLGEGELLAVEFVNQGEVYRAVRWAPDGGKPDFYTPEGKSLRKAFLRAPLEFTRVSSRFNLYRRHPILNRMRAHRGVDYAAPIGTPVKAAGGGRVAFVGIKGGYGKVVELTHPGGVRTVYGHLSAFARGLRPGQSVAQGQPIGKVGMTGLATGPHLHYEFLLNGVHKDPQKVPLPKAEPVPASQRAAFDAYAASLSARLASGQPAASAGGAPVAAALPPPAPTPPPASGR
ncbi:MAG: M23 family metallopeptidase [Gammaproteobacteria bacterium]